MPSCPLHNAPMSRFHRESLIHDPIHGYIPFTSPGGSQSVAERDVIDHPWVQRLRQIHQLQTAWWVFPSAEHTRFQHVLGAMHLGSRVTAQLLMRVYLACAVRIRTGSPAWDMSKRCSAWPAYCTMWVTARRPFLRRTFSCSLPGDTRDARVAHHRTGTGPCVA